MDRAPLYSSFPMTSSPWVICNRGTLLFPFPHERASEREWLNATKPHQTAGFLELQLSRHRTEKEERQALLMKCLEASKIMTTRFCVWHKSELKSQRQRAWLLLILLGNYLIVICGIVCHYEWVVKIMRSLNNKLRDSVIFGHFIVKKKFWKPGARSNFTPWEVMCFFWKRKCCSSTCLCSVKNNQIYTIFYLVLVC